MAGEAATRRYKRERRSRGERAVFQAQLSWIPGSVRSQLVADEEDAGGEPGAGSQPKGHGRRRGVSRPLSIAR